EPEHPLRQAGHRGPGDPGWPVVAELDAAVTSLVLERPAGAQADREEPGAGMAVHGGRETSWLSDSTRSSWAAASAVRSRPAGSLRRAGEWRSSSEAAATLWAPFPEAGT